MRLQQLGYNNGNGVFSMWSVPRYYEQDSLKQSVTLANDRPALSPERAPDIKKPVTVRQ
jgi:hypothetical protein